MVMDLNQSYGDFSDSLNGFEFKGETGFNDPDQYLNLESDFKFKDELIDLSFMDKKNYDLGVSPPSFVSFSPVEESSSTSSDSDLSDPVLKYISQMLMEEDMDEKPSMLHDSLALHVAEKPFYEALGHAYPPSPNQPPFFLDSPDENHDGYSVSQPPLFRSSNNRPFSLDSPDENHDGYSVSQLPLFGSSNNGYSNGNGFAPVSSFQLPDFDFFRNSESILQFNRGVEEASKFLPKTSNLVVDLDSYTLAPDRKEAIGNVFVKVEDEEKEKEHSPNGSKGKKREDVDREEERVNKQSAIYVDEDELSEMFDRVLLCKVKEEPLDGIAIDDLKNLQNVQIPIPISSNGGKGRARKQENVREIVDLRNLLILCAQAVSADDRRTANELLKQIRQHSSPLGDGTQRLARCFANGLEARLSGTGTQICTALASKRSSVAAVLKGYQVYIQSCPFKKISMGYANQMILNLANKAKTKTLHIIDFGILYGFQWPILIQHLSEREGGPPKLRITGIELPQPGFRPAERVEETGRRLRKYCERFNVPFEYNAIAQKWDTISVEDLNIDKTEIVAVICLNRFKNLLDETVTANSPRTAVLNLIRRINPDIFTPSIVNGTYNAPFFLTRFREALFYFSALYDMFDTIIPRESPERLMFEEEFYGREVVNVIACEGSERVERPETYKRWQVRNLRAGFRPLPLDREIVDELRKKGKKCYHKDFVVDEDGGWLLSGWKGRILYASSCWVPA